MEEGGEKQGRGKREVQRSPIPASPPRMPSTAKLSPGQSQQAGAAAGYAPVWQGPKHFGLYLLPPQEAGVGDPGLVTQNAGDTTGLLHAVPNTHPTSFLTKVINKSNLIKKKSY